MEIETTLEIEPQAPTWMPNWLANLLLPAFEIDVVMDVGYDVENNSIGWMEIWGHKCYDHQPDYIGGTWLESVDHDKADVPLRCRLFCNVDYLVESQAETLCESGDLTEEIGEREFDF